MRKHSLGVHFVLGLAQCLQKQLGWKNMKYVYKICMWQRRGSEITLKKTEKVLKMV